MARLLKDQVPGFPKFGEGKWDQVLEGQKKALEPLQQIHNALPEGKWEGYIARFPIADGYALYRVVKAKPLTLQHIPYLDAYRAPDALIRGLRLSDLQKQRDFTAFWKKQR